MSSHDKYLYKVVGLRPTTYYWILTAPHKPVLHYATYWRERAISDPPDPPYQKHLEEYWLVNVKGCRDNIPLEPVDEFP